MGGPATLYHPSDTVVVTCSACTGTFVSNQADAEQVMEIHNAMHEIGPGDRVELVADAAGDPPRLRIGDQGTVRRVIYDQDRYQITWDRTEPCSGECGGQVKLSSTFGIHFFQIRKVEA